LQNRLSCSEINAKFHKKGQKDEKPFRNGEGLSSLQQISCSQDAEDHLPQCWTTLDKCK